MRELSRKQEKSYIDGGASRGQMTPQNEKVKSLRKNIDEGAWILY